MAKILVVDDSRLTRRIISKAVKEAGHEVVEACNGQEGLDTFREQEFDCVMSDLLMPIMDGFELAENIRSESPATPIIITTADIQESTQLRCETIGVTKMLSKPAKSAVIQETLASALESITEGAVGCD